MPPSNITLVLTSCDRHDLLRLTLDTFHEFVDITLDESVIIEDSMTPRPEWLTVETYPKLGKITWLQNTTKLGQMASINRAYAEVKTDYIFHCEDDWRFIRGDFMQKSMNILKQYPKISMVAITGMLLTEDPRYPFPIVKPLPHFNQGWCGISFHPGLRRKSDYIQLQSFYKRIFKHELDASYAFKNADYLMADLGLPGHALHAGNDRSSIGGK